VCDLETSRMGAPYIYDISHLRVNKEILRQAHLCHLSDNYWIYIDIKCRGKCIICH